MKIVLRVSVHQSEKDVEAIKLMHEENGFDKKTLKDFISKYCHCEGQSFIEFIAKGGLYETSVKSYADGGISMDWSFTEGYPTAKTSRQGR